MFCFALPAAILALSMADLADKVINILYVAIGLGLVIFFHELGHFAVAKWCDVLVERFSIGFGPILWARKWGETEYAFSAIPFGGYVKMLGQDDIDPSQLTSDEIAQDPRSYSAKPVWQRMAIISAGVTMNVLTAVLFFAAAYGIGLMEPQAVIGGVVAGGPAWEAGIRAGDEFQTMNGKLVRNFKDILRGTILSTGSISISGVHANGKEFAVSVMPNTKGTRRRIGAGPSGSLTVATLASKESPLMTGLPAAKAEERLQSGDRIVAVNGEPVASKQALAESFVRHRAETITVTIERPTTPDGETASDKTPSKKVTLKIGPNPARTLGLRVEFGQITSIVTGSPADEAGIKPGDQITTIDGKDVGGTLNPMRLPYYFGERAGEPVEITLQRKFDSGSPKPVTVTLVPEDRPGWVERPETAGEPLAVPAIGIAFQLSPRVLAVVPGGPADQAGIEKGNIIESLTFVLPKETPLETRFKKREITIPMVKKVEGRTNFNFAFALSRMQVVPQRYVLVELKDHEKPVRVDPWSDPEDTWYMPMRGFITKTLMKRAKAEGVGEALTLGVDRTIDTVVDLYLTLRNLFTGRLSFTELHGPLGIAKIAYQISQNGMAKLLQFLAYLSVNLAVLNFLPIPVLDGGHMVFLLWEAVTRRKPSEKAVQVATMVGLAFILTLMVAVIYMDIFIHDVFQ